MRRKTKLLKKGKIKQQLRRLVYSSLITHLSRASIM